MAGKGANAVVVAVDGRVAGALLLADHLRTESPTVLRRLRAAGVDRIVLLTGDHSEVAAMIMESLDLDGFKSDLKPMEKAAAVQEEKAHARVLMVGDGVNDAPALAAADIGVAMGARGAAASSEAADVVILLDRLDKLVTALQIGRRTRTIALQSAFAGVGLSIAAMVAAAFGYLPAIDGAVLQEVIDVAVILNALRALADPIVLHRRPGKLSADELLALEGEHRNLSTIVEQIRNLADDLPRVSALTLSKRLEDLNSVLASTLLPHEKRDESQLYPKLGRQFHAADALAGMSRGHMEIRQRSALLVGLTASLPDDPDETVRREIQRLLDGLEAILRLHFEQEDEIYRQLEAG
jgi:soluble P-type ATPase